MFGWPHEEIEAECETLRFELIYFDVLNLYSKLGYMGVKVFPPQEQVMSNQPFNNILNPWYFMYQPVSYRLQGIKRVCRITSKQVEWEQEIN
jgi:alpha-amylase